METKFIIEFLQGVLLAFLLIKTLNYLDVKYKTLILRKNKGNPLIVNTSKILRQPKPKQEVETQKKKFTTPQLFQKPLSKKVTQKEGVQVE